MGAESCLQKEDADAGDLTQGNTVLLSLADCPSKNGSLLLDGIALSLHSAGPMAGASARRMMEECLAQKQCSGLSVHQHLQNAPCTSCWFAACDTTAPRLPCTVLRTPHLDPKLPGCCTTCNMYISALSGTSDSCHLWEFPEGDTQRPYLSKMSSWFLDIHVLFQDLPLLEHLSNYREVFRTLSCEGEEVQTNPIFWINANTNYINLFGFEKHIRICKKMHCHT